MSQSKFAKTFHLSESNIKNWEQGRRIPDEAAKILLTVINKNPKAVIEDFAVEKINIISTKTIP